MESTYKTEKAEHDKTARYIKNGRQFNNQTSQMFIFVIQPYLSSIFPYCVFVIVS